MPLHPATEAALSEPVVTIAGLIEMVLPGYTLRVCDGSGVVPAGAWAGGGAPFEGSDDRFGVLSAISPITSGEGNAAPALDFSFLPASTAAAADLSSPAFQGSRDRVWLAVIDRATGLVIGNPERVFFGLIDTTELVLGRNSRELNIQCVSGFERMFANNEGQRLADAYHQSIWPGELGLANATGVTKNSPWGVASPPRGVSYGNGSAGIGGGGPSSAIVGGMVNAL
jgi:hypothetical protein